MDLLLTSVNIFRLEFLERGDRDVCDKSVQFVGRVLVIVAPPRKSHSDPEWNISVKDIKM